MTTALKQKTRPILFSGEMARAIMTGHKTQTRRVIDRVHGLGPVTCLQGSETTGYDWCLRGRRDMWNEFRHDEFLKLCPYGVPGDLLWGREQVSFSVGDLMTDRPYTKIPKDAVLADGTHVTCWYAADNNRPTWAKTPWHPSIHMPRWASRILLKIMDVRVERLCDITEADAYAEGVTVTEDHRSSPDFDFRNDARTAFRHLWEGVYGSGSTLINPWVWVIEFKRLGIGHG